MPLTDFSRAEHLQWCKDRALEYARIGDTKNAMASMFSDLRKHPGTQGHMAIELGMMMLINGHLNSREKCIEFIEGFN